MGAKTEGRFGRASVLGESMRQNKSLTMVVGRRLWAASERVGGWEAALGGFQIDVGRSFGRRPSDTYV
jgi:hypothetical protein